MLPWVVAVSTDNYTAWFSLRNISAHLTSLADHFYVVGFHIKMSFSRWKIKYFGKSMHLRYFS